MTQESLSHPPGSRIDIAEKATPASAAPEPVTSPLSDICLALRRKVLAFVEEKSDDEVVRHTQTQTRVSMEVIEDALRRYRPEELSLSYNGGKDCLALLVLLLACLPSTTTTGTDGPDAPVATAKPPIANPSVPIQPIQAIYIAPPDPFPEVEEFVNSSTKEYHLDLNRYALPMRAALEAYQTDRIPVKAIFMGTRRTDPHSEFLEHFSPTDQGWPQFMRINPMIDWHYQEIWAFIRGVGIPYCSLYDRGFSSLGGVNNTRPNPALALDSEGKSFRPAFELKHDKEERLGRDR